MGRWDQIKGFINVGTEIRTAIVVDAEGFGTETAAPTIFSEVVISISSKKPYQC